MEGRDGQVSLNFRNFRKDDLTLWYQYAMVFAAVRRCLGLSMPVIEMHSGYSVMNRALGIPAIPCFKKILSKICVKRSKTACWMGLFKIITFTQFSHRCLIGFSQALAALHRFLIGFLQDKGFSKVSRRLLIGFPKFLIDLLPGFSQVSYRFLIGFSYTSYQVSYRFLTSLSQEQVPHRFLTGFSQVSHRYLMGILEVSRGFLVGFLQVSDGFLIGFLQVSRRFLMGYSNSFLRSFLQVSHRFLAGFPAHRFLRGF